MSFLVYVLIVPIPRTDDDEELFERIEIGHAGGSHLLAESSALVRDLEDRGDGKTLGEESSQAARHECIPQPDILLLADIVQTEEVLPLPLEHSYGTAPLVLAAHRYRPVAQEQHIGAI